MVDGWHALSVAASLEQLGADAVRGLSGDEARARLAAHGPNVLEVRRPEPRWQKVKEPLTEPLVLLLVGVGALYALLGNLDDALTILVVILVVAGVEIATESRARRAIAALRRIGAPMASVVRDGAQGAFAATDLVCGDLVLLQAGTRVPADLRLVNTAALRVDESTLTGESVPVTKVATAMVPPEAELSERRTLAFAGTVVVAGKGRGVVVATGSATELGRIARLTETVREPRTPLQLQMKHLAGLLVWVALAFSALVPLLGVLFARRPLQEMLLTGLTLAFATIPEELPILITIVLGLGAYRLAREHAIVKRLRAAETLGCVSVVCTDKTGTLTENRMRVTQITASDGRLLADAQTAGSPAARRLLEAGVLASDAQVLVPAQVPQQPVDRRDGFAGDPTETALLAAAEAAGIGIQSLRAEARVLAEFPLDDLRHRMSVVVQRAGGERWLLMKGSPESVLADCTADADIVKEAQQQAGDLASHGLRVLAFAERRLVPGEDVKDDPLMVERDLVFLGLAALEDPPRPEVPAAIAALTQAGVRVLMLTGDHPSTARAIAEQVGIDAAQVLRGRDLEELTQPELFEIVTTTSVFARIAPAQKLRLVEVLQLRGEVVALTGDGVNDAPALRQAAVGIAMGRSGTDVAREAADLVLADDNFATVATAVRAGRSLYANLRKAVRYYLAAKVALVAASLAAVLAQLPVPFEPIQIIVLELFMDLGASTTFVAEPPEEDVMARPPRNPRQPFMDRALQGGILAGGAGLAAAVAIPYFWTWQSVGDVTQARTAAFAAWMIGHIVLAAHMRAEHQPLLRTNPLANRSFLVWAGAAMSLLVFGQSVPFLQDRLHLVPLAGSTWAVVLLAALLLPSWWEPWKWAHRLAAARR